MTYLSRGEGSSARLERESSRSVPTERSINLRPIFWCTGRPDQTSSALPLGEGGDRRGGRMKNERREPAEGEEEEEKRRTCRMKILMRPVLHEPSSWLVGSLCLTFFGPFHPARRGGQGSPGDLTEGSILLLGVPSLSRSRRRDELRYCPPSPWRNGHVCLWRTESRRWASERAGREMVKKSSHSTRLLLSAQRQ